MVMGLLIAFAIFILLGMGMITIVKSTTYEAKQEDNVSDITLSRYTMNQLDIENTSRRKDSETLGPLYGKRLGGSLEGYDYEHFKGKTEELDEGKRGAQYTIEEGSEIEGAPEGMEEIALNLSKYMSKYMNKR